MVELFHRHHQCHRRRHHNAQDQFDAYLDDSEMTTMIDSTMTSLIITMNPQEGCGHHLDLDRRDALMRRCPITRQRTIITITHRHGDRHVGLTMIMIMMITLSAVARIEPDRIKNHPEVNLEVAHGRLLL
jgi:hypothetical protein